jgi:hypothetical protein
MSALNNEEATQLKKLQEGSKKQIAKSQRNGETHQKHRKINCNGTS